MQRQLLLPCYLKFARRLQRIQKRLAPPVHIVLPDARHELLVARLPLGQWHLQRLLNAVGHPLGVVGVHQQRFFQLLCRTGKA